MDRGHKHTCKFCSKSFPCGRSLGGHMRSHVSSTGEKLPGDHSLGNGYGLRENPKKTRRLSWPGGGGAHNEDAPTRKRRSRRAAPIASSSSSVSDCEEQEDVAVTLMMLSRDVGYWICESDSESRKGSKLGKGRYECATCKKSFQSYQALGGHRASHKRHKGGCCGESSLDTDASVDHQCVICGKVFASGQALGGHKRVHLATGSPVTATEEAVTMPDLLDLNFPAPIEEDSSNARDGADAAEFDSWWTGSNLKSDGMAGMMANR